MSSLGFGTRFVGVLTLAFFVNGLIEPYVVRAQPRVAEPPRREADEASEPREEPELSDAPRSEAEGQLGEAPRRETEGQLGEAPRRAPSGSGRGNDAPPVSRIAANAGGQEAPSSVTPQAIQLPNAEGSVEGMGESFSPDLSSGTATFGVPIAVAPGRAGVQPSLGLSYASSNGNGPLGIGWNMAVPFIARQTDRGLPRYKGPNHWHPESDRFIYNGGQELVPVDSYQAMLVDVAGPTELAADVPEDLAGFQQYRARVEGGFMRFFQDPSGKSWVVQSMDGTRFEFGLLPAHEGGPANLGSEAALQSELPGGGGRIFAWFLTRMSDAYGSTIYYRYQEHGGARYLRDIHYLSPASCASEAEIPDVVAQRRCDAELESYGARVSFAYEPRPDAFASYITGWRVQQAQRLTRITVTSAEETVGTRYLVRRYHLTYDASVYHSLLKSVQLEGRVVEAPDEHGVVVFVRTEERSIPSSIVGQTMPPMRFEYSAAPVTSRTVAGFGGIDATVRTVTSSPPVSLGGRDAELYDVNSDGLPDLVVANPAVFRTPAGAPAVGVFFNGFRGPNATPAENAATFSDAIPMPMDPSRSGQMRFSNPSALAMDVDGDGRGDLLNFPRLAEYGYFTPARTNPNPQTSPAAQGWRWVYSQAAVPTPGADPRVDLLRDGTHYRVLDVNNDHLTDIVKTTGNSIQTWLNLGWVPGGDGRFGQASYAGGSWQLSTEPLTTCLPHDGLPIDFADPEIQLGDMNGDGIDDIVRLRRGNITYWPGRGESVWGEGDLRCNVGFGTNRHIAMASSPAEINHQTSAVYLNDVNGDGASDVVQIRFQQMDVWFNRGGYAFTERVTVQSPYAPEFRNHVAFSDIDGSGTTDLVYGQGGKWTYLDFLGGTRPRLLVGVENSLGAETTIGYGSSADDYLSDLARYGACTGANCPQFTWDSVEGTDCDARLQERSGECVYRSGGSPVISSVVRFTETTDHFELVGREPTVMRTEFAYHNAYYEGIEQEFRGFGAADARVLGDEAGPTSWTRTWFMQGRRPSELASDRMAENPNEALKGRAYLTETFDETGTYLSSSFASATVRRLHVGLDGRHVSYAYMHSQDDVTYDTSAGTTGGPPLSLVLMRYEHLDQSRDAEVVGERTVPFLLRGMRFMWTRTRTTSVNNLGHVLEATADGRLHDEDDPAMLGESVAALDYEEAITSFMEATSIAEHPSGWIFRTSRAYTRGHGDLGAPLGDTNTYFDTLGGAVGTTTYAFLPVGAPGAPTNGEYLFNGDARSPLDRVSEEQTLKASARFDAWGQGIVSCAGTDIAEAESELDCRRYAEVERDTEYAQMPRTERIAVGTTGAGPTTSFRMLGSSAVTERGLGLTLSVTDPNGVVSSMTYDGFGRPTSATPPSTDACEVDGPATVITYVERVEGLPLSQVRTVTDARTPSGGDDCGAELVSRATAYADALGRARVALQDWEQESGTSKIRTSVADYTRKGAAHCAFDADVLPENVSIRAALTLPSTPTVCTESDAFGRPITVSVQDGATSYITYTASSQSAFDPLDLDGSSAIQHRNTPSTTRVDGHGRTIDQVLRLRQPGESSTSFIRLFTTYRADGAVLRVRRAETASAAPDATVVNGHEVERLFVYDTAGRRIGHTDPDSDNPADSNDATRHWRYLFNDLGELAAVRDPRGCGQDFFYDRAGRLVAEDYITCAEAQEAGDLSDETVPEDAYGTSPAGAGREADVRYYFDALPAWIYGADTTLPTDPEVYALGRATGSVDRTQRSVAVYDARGQAVWSARQMALLPEALTLATTTYSGALPEMPAETGSVGPRVWDEVNTYVTTSRYDHAGRAIGLELPADPDWLLYGDSGDPSTPPVVGGAMTFDERGLPEEASLVIDGAASRIAHLTYDHFGRVTDTDIGNPDHHQVAHVDYDVRHRPVQAWFKRDPTTGGLPGDVLPGTRYPYWYHYTWDAANNLTRITDVAGYAIATFQDGHRQRTVHVTHDSLYRVAQVDFTYRAPNGRWTPHDAATDWRGERTRTNADGQTHRDVDPMDREPAEMVPSLPAERVQNLTYQYDWLANMTEWTDDASAFYERSLGDIGNGAGHAGRRPSALYVATNIAHSEPAADATADRGGYVEVDYGASGNVLAFTVHAQCRDASPTNVCYGEDPAVADSDAVRTALRQRCVCDADTEQHVQVRWDELNRLVEARRYDRDTGAWTLAVRQRHRYDGGNVRLIKETLDVDQADPSLRQRVTLSVIPGDFERAGVRADGEAMTPAYRGSAALRTETQYAVAGARLVRSRGEEAGALNARHRLTYGLADLIQSTSALIDLESGDLFESTTFYPNGARETHRTTTKSSVPVEPVGFTGKEEDEEVGLTYFGERWLNPRIGRWASADPLSIHALGGGETSNCYHYVSGNLLQARDVIGLEGTRLADGRVEYQNPPGSRSATEVTVAYPTAEERRAVEEGVRSNWIDYGSMLAGDRAIDAYNQIRQLSPGELLSLVTSELERALREDAIHGLDEQVFERIAAMHTLLRRASQDTYDGWTAQGELYSLGMMVLISLGFSFSTAPIAAARSSIGAADVPQPNRPDAPNAQVRQGQGEPQRVVRPAPAPQDFSRELGVSADTARSHLREAVPGTGGQAHHLVPWQARSHPLVQRAARGGFNINGAENGIRLGSNLHRGSHPTWNARVIEHLDDIYRRHPNISDEQAAEFVRSLADGARRGIPLRDGRID